MLILFLCLCGLGLFTIEHIVDEIESLLNVDTDSARVKGLGIQIQGLRFAKVGTP